MSAEIQSIMGKASAALSEDDLRMNRRRLFDFIRRRVPTREDAEDLLQDVFYQMTLSFTATEPIETISAWLITITRNKIVDWYRRKRLPSLPLPPFETDDDGLILDLVADSASDPLAVLEQAEFWMRFSQALDSLTPAQREVFVQHEMDGKSYREISDETGLPVKTLISRRHDAVVNLRRLLSDEL